jgi:hypothetical protein
MPIRFLLAGAVMGSLIPNVSDGNLALNPLALRSTTRTNAVW